MPLASSRRCVTAAECCGGPSTQAMPVCDVAGDSGSGPNLAQRGVSRTTIQEVGSWLVGQPSQSFRGS